MYKFDTGIRFCIYAGCALAAYGEVLDGFAQSLPVIFWSIHAAIVILMIYVLCKQKIKQGYFLGHIGVLVCLYAIALWGTPWGWAFIVGVPIVIRCFENYRLWHI